MPNHPWAVSLLTVVAYGCVGLHIAEDSPIPPEESLSVSLVLVLWSPSVARRAFLVMLYVIQSFFTALCHG